MLIANARHPPGNARTEATLIHAPAVAAEATVFRIYGARTGDDLTQEVAPERFLVAIHFRDGVTYAWDMPAPRCHAAIVVLPRSHGHDDFAYSKADLGDRGLMTSVCHAAPSRYDVLVVVALAYPSAGGPI